VHSVRHRRRQLWFCVAERDGWTFCYRLIPSERHPVVAEVRIVPTPAGDVVSEGRGGEPEGLEVPPDGGLTAGTVRDRFTLAEHVYEVLPRAFRQLDHASAVEVVELGTTADGETYPVFTGQAHPGVMSVLAESLGLEPGLEPRAGRRGPKVDLVRSARICADYLTACAAGSRSPAADAARRHDMTPVAVRAVLKRARTRDGLMTRQTQGKAGGELTPRAEEILNQHGRS
jgi:hypothetical protein